MTDEELARFRALFVQTAQQHISNLRLIASSLQQADPKMIEQMHMDAHSLKGQSYAMNYQTLAMAAKHLEYVFAAMMEKQVRLTPEQQQVIVNLIESIAHSVDAIAQNNTELDLTAQNNAFIERFTDIVSKW